jgi:hypothetical protein
MSMETARLAFAMRRGDDYWESSQRRRPRNSGGGRLREYAQQPRHDRLQQFKNVYDDAVQPINLATARSWYDVVEQFVAIVLPVANEDSRLSRVGAYLRSSIGTRASMPAAAKQRVRASVLRGAFQVTAPEMSSLR